MSRRSPTALAPIAGLAFALLLAPAASALTIGDISALYFTGVSGFGFDAGSLTAAGIARTFRAAPGDDWIEAGERSLGLPIRITQNLGTIHQDPEGDGETPGMDNPYIADSRWTVKNKTGRDLLAPLLVFTLVDPLDSYPDVPTGLDGDLLQILEYSSAGEEYLFGVVALPDLEENGSVDIDVRYVVAGPLEDDFLPPLGLMALGSYETLVPEPGGLLLWGSLLALGVGFGLARRRRSQRSSCSP
jgi:hypothetical protein